MHIVLSNMKRLLNIFRPICGLGLTIPFEWNEGIFCNYGNELFIHKMVVHYSLYWMNQLIDRHYYVGYKNLKVYLRLITIWYNIDKKVELFNKCVHYKIHRTNINLHKPINCITKGPNLLLHFQLKHCSMGFIAYFVLAKIWYKCCKDILISGISN